VVSLSFESFSKVGEIRIIMLGPTFAISFPTLRQDLVSTCDFIELLWIATFIWVEFES